MYHFHVCSLELIIATILGVLPLCNKDKSYLITGNCKKKFSDINFYSLSFQNFLCFYFQSLLDDHACSDDEYADLDWDNLGFGITPAEHMYIAKCSKDQNFEQGQLSRYGNIELNPSAGVLNYGQASYS